MIKKFYHKNKIFFLFIHIMNERQLTELKKAKAPIVAKIRKNDFEEDTDIINELSDDDLFLIIMEGYKYLYTKGDRDFVNIPMARIMRGKPAMWTNEIDTIVEENLIDFIYREIHDEGVNDDD